jgi:hypothetical protein
MKKCMEVCESFKEMCISDILSDETTLRRWMTQCNIPMPEEEFWHASSLRLSDVLSTTGMRTLGVQGDGHGSMCPPHHRLEMFMEAAQYYTRVVGGEEECVMAEMLRHYR